MSPRQPISKPSSFSNLTFYVPHTCKKGLQRAAESRAYHNRDNIQEKVLGQDLIHFYIRSKKPRRKLKPANEVSEGDINALLQAIRDFDGYPKLKDLSRIVHSLTPLQINVIVRYLERSGAIVIDTEGYIVWAARKEQDQLTLGEAAEMSGDLKEYLAKYHE